MARAQASTALVRDLVLPPSRQSILLTKGAAIAAPLRRSANRFASHPMADPAFNGSWVSDTPQRVTLQQLREAYRVKLTNLRQEPCREIASRSETEGPYQSALFCS